MNVKVTLGFLVVLVLLGGLVVGLDRFKVGQAPATAAEQQQELTIFQFDDRKAQSFTLRDGSTTVKFVKTGDNWAIEGMSDPPNRISLTSLLIRLSQLKGTKKVGDTGGDLKQFGLDQPKQEVTAVLDDGTTYTLQLGNRTPTGTGVYAKKSDAAEVYIVGTQFSDDIVRLANDPKEPPTPTPRPSPTATPVPTPGATPSPTG